MIVFRLDANASVATGHLYRCMAIAQKLKEKNEDCTFLLAQNLYTELLEQNGFKYRVLDIRWDDWNYGIDEVLLALKELEADYLVVDSYKVTEDFFKRVHECVPVFYLDDICNMKYELDATLHYSEWGEESVIGELYAGTGVKTFAGLQYVPLRSSFENVTPKEKKQYDILITTGGSDSYHITLQLLKMINNQRDRFNCVNICAILGRFNTDFDEISEIVRENKNITIMQNISNMHEVMSDSRVALTAGGSSVYELMASSVPFVVFGFSDDQEIFGTKLAEHGISTYAGDARKDAKGVAERILEELTKLLMLPPVNLANIASTNKTLVDGKGALRIAELIIDLKKEKCS